MVLRFTWKRSEWREAYLLSTTEQDRTAGPLPMGYLILGLTAAGGAGDLAHALRHAREAVLHDSFMPVLLLLGALCVLVAGMLIWASHRERFRGLPALPEGEQQVTLHEMGWTVGSNANASAKPVRAWSEMCGQRTGRRVLTLLTRDGSTVSVPFRALTEDQGGWLERLLLRKMPRFA